MTALPKAFLDALDASFPKDFGSTDASDLSTYGRDWTQVYSPNASLLVRPRTTDEVARFIRLCARERVPVVPSGGRTGLAGGAVAAKGEVVLSLERMRHLGPVDTASMTVDVEAGSVTEAVHQHCAPAGLTWPVDFASKGSSQVGGNIATNAGGVRVIRYGLTRQWVLGLTVVTGTGDVLKLNGALEKNNTGIDLRQVFIGSEGILGVITQATLKLAKLPVEPQVMLFAVDGLDSVLRLFREARKGPFTINAFEFFTGACAERVERHRKLMVPFDSPASHYVLLEVEAHPHHDLDQWLMSLFDQRLVQHGTRALSREQAQGLWSLRESISESLSATGLPHKNDIALPIAALEAFCTQLETQLPKKYPGWNLCLFGHIGDGNLHVNIMKPDAMPKADFLRQTHAVDSDIFTWVRAHGGSISAEHGVGLLKKDFLHFSRSPEEVRLMRALKSTFDPSGILNPGKVLPDIDGER